MRRLRNSAENMTYRIETTDEADADAERAYRWIANQAPERASDWYNGLLDAVDSLKEHPMRCPLAPEDQGFRPTIRQLLYGKRTGIYRVLFMIRDDTVYVLRILHGARQSLEP